jgi:hypothetical protein
MVWIIAFRFHFSQDECNCIWSHSNYPLVGRTHCHDGNRRGRASLFSPSGQKQAKVQFWWNERVLILPTMDIDDNYAAERDNSKSGILIKDLKMLWFMLITRNRRARLCGPT